MEFWRANVIAALQVAIKVQRKYEREKMHYDSDSALVAGWQQLLDEVKSRAASTIWLKD